VFWGSSQKVISLHMIWGEHIAHPINGISLSVLWLRVEVIFHQCIRSGNTGQATKEDRARPAARPENTVDDQRIPIALAIVARSTPGSFSKSFIYPLQNMQFSL
jgi:hypothetical protein